MTRFKTLHKSTGYFFKSDVWCKVTHAFLDCHMCCTWRSHFVRTLSGRKIISISLFAWQSRLVATSSSPCPHHQHFPICRESPAPTAFSILNLCTASTRFLRSFPMANSFALVIDCRRMPLLIPLPINLYFPLSPTCPSDGERVFGMLWAQDRRFRFRWFRVNHDDCHCHAVVRDCDNGGLPTETTAMGSRHANENARVSQCRWSHSCC